MAILPYARFVLFLARALVLHLIRAYIEWK